jgi:bifunctional DNA-binding transcriptional regulator/antitoxin component of YhaV-PrlF toxin-antitoxin module
MAKVTSKLQVTLPKALAAQYGIAPGSEIEWQAAGEAIRVLPPRSASRRALTDKQRLALFDAATARQKQRQREKAKAPATKSRAGDRGWTREDLYERATTR